VDISDRSATKEIYSVKEVYRKDPFYMRFVPKGFDNVFSINDTDLHRRYRRLLSNPMSESSLKTVYGVIEANVDFAIRRIHEEMETRGAADTFKWWMFMATDIIGELSFGESFRMPAL
jgi:cytochrome P450